MGSGSTSSRSQAAAPVGASVQAQHDGASSFLLFDDDDSEGEDEEELMEEDDQEEDDSEISGCAEGCAMGRAAGLGLSRRPERGCPAPLRYSVENSFFDEKEDTCVALGEISTNSR